jgi:polyphosphate kinase 2 (PPK2 family)
MRENLWVPSLTDVDLSLKLSGEEGRKRLEPLQQRLLMLRLQAGGLLGDERLGPPLMVMFEGWDAAGKGGAIRRLIGPLDPRHVRVAQFGAPGEHERRRHFLARFWSVVPGWSEMTVCDRSWYGRVLVERVERLATETEWSRAYDEIVDFERSFHTEGGVLVKFWLHISKDEQLKRFQARERHPLKRWKLTEEDWRNFAKRDEYEDAVADMLEKTDHHHARWVVVAAESKPFARVQVLEAVIEAFERGMRDAGRQPVARSGG